MGLLYSKWPHRPYKSTEEEKMKKKCKGAVKLRKTCPKYSKMAKLSNFYGFSPISLFGHFKYNKHIFYDNFFSGSPTWPLNLEPYIFAQSQKPWHFQNYLFYISGLFLWQALKITWWEKVFENFIFYTPPYSAASSISSTLHLQCVFW